MQAITYCHYALIEHHPDTPYKSNHIFATSNSEDVVKHLLAKSILAFKLGFQRGKGALFVGFDRLQKCMHL
jgi:hypothetical protein